METKHTQGEWSHEVEKDGMNINDVVKHNNQYIATIHVTGTTEEWNANAKLIAAAPELLAALQTYVEYMIHDQTDKWFDKYKDDENADHILIGAIKAIKKATE